MNNIMRMIALLLCIAVLCMSLCSCQYLDDAKESAAYYLDDSKNSFTFRGQTYRRITTKSNQMFILDDTATENVCHVAAPDVPVLMVARYGNLMVFNITDDAPIVINVLQTAVDESYYSDGYYASYEIGNDYSWTYAYYVREDEYDRIRMLLEENPVDRYFTRVYNYDSDVQWDGRADMSRRLLDEATGQAIDRTLQDGKLTDWRILMLYNCYTVSLYPCDTEMLITNGKSYTLVTNNVDYYLCDDINYQLKKVSDGDREQMRKLYNQNRDAAGYADINWFADRCEDINGELDYSRN